MSLKEAATEVLKLIEAGRYSVDSAVVDFANQQASAVDKTRLYKPKEIESLPPSASAANKPTIRVTDGTTQVIALQMTTTGDSNNQHVGLLNFASARNPGGGFLNGAKAQEEDLCRCSGLYPCLLQCMEYYDINRKQDSLLYTDHAIFSPLVPFFKTCGTGEFVNLPFVVSVITAPAPNSAPFLRGNPNLVDELAQTFRRRWRNVLRIARDQNITHLLLGAWGCGAFGGDPIVASTTAKDAIESEGAGFEEIVFAIPGTGHQSKANLMAFERTFQHNE